MKNIPLPLYTMAILFQAFQIFQIQMIILRLKRYFDGLLQEDMDLFPFLFIALKDRIRVAKAARFMCEKLRRCLCDYLKFPSTTFVVVHLITYSLFYPL